MTMRRTILFKEALAGPFEAVPGTDMVLYVNSDTFTPANDKLIPTGEMRPVEGTPFDFRTPKAIGQDINKDYDQLVLGNGYDHNWVSILTVTSTSSQ